MQFNKTNFGKYSDKTLPQILFTDPDWFFFSFEDGRFNSRPHLRGQAYDLYEKARSIRIPQSDGEPKEIEYKFSRATGKFEGCNLVPESRPDHIGSTHTVRSDVIDMRAPRCAKAYDKRGGKLLIKDIKKILWGNPSARLNRERCEAFFSDDSNFACSLN